MPKSLPACLVVLLLVLALPATAHNNPVFVKRPVLVLEVQPNPDDSGDHSETAAIEFDRETIRFHYEVVSCEPLDAIRFTVQGDVAVLGTGLVHGDQTKTPTREVSDSGPRTKRTLLRVREVTGANKPFVLIIRAEELKR